MQRIYSTDLSESSEFSELSQSDELDDEELGERLLEAAEEGDLDAVNELLNLGADVNYADCVDYTALTKASEGGHVEVVRRLLQEERIDTAAEVYESRDSIGGIALHIAAYNGEDEIVKMLVKHSPENINEMEYCGYTPLHETIVNGQFYTFMLLLRLGASYEAWTEESSATETPDRLNALGLIMHELTNSYSNNQHALLKMLFWLLDNYDSDRPRYKPFKETARGDKLYKLVKRYHNNPEGSRAAILNLFQVEQSSLECLETKGVFGDCAELSDSDSEDVMEYEYVDRLELSRAKVEEKIERNFAHEESDALISHFRGIHRYPAHLKMDGDDLKVAKAQEEGRLSIPSIYSAASHELADVPYELPPSHGLETQEAINQYSQLLDARTQRLSEQDTKILDAINLMRSQEQVKPCMSASASRKLYETRYHEFIQRYVNSYAGLMADMEKSASVDIGKLKASASKEKFSLFKKFGFKKLPLVSTTEDVHWAFEYAASLVSYDKKSTFRPNPNSGAQPLRPCYLPNGRPRFPYLGIVYTTLHAYEELLDSTRSERVLDLFAENSIDTRCAAPGGHVTGGYIRAKERIFVNSIDADRVFIAMILRVPNFSYPYRKDMLGKYGLSQKQYDKFKSDLHNFGPVGDSETLRNENQYFRVQLKIIEFVIEYQQNKLLDFINSCVKNKSFTLKALGQTSEDLIDPIIRDGKEEKEFISKFVKQRKELQESLQPAPQPSSLVSQSIFRDDESKKRKRDESSDKETPPSKKSKYEKK